MPNIDERVVSMQFDNKEFDPKLKKSQKTFEEFKESLSFEKGSKALKNFEKQMDGFDTKGMSSKLSGLGKAFSALETVIQGALTSAGFRIENFIYRTINMALSDGIRYGWAAYADTVIATQTIMAATRSQFSDTATQINYVTHELDELRTFADETSYSFRDMTDNVGKFTSQGLKLDTAVSAMEGISNWASLSGATVGQASRAMYNLSQSLGMGYLMMRDWMSIENANMATVEFKQTAIDTAVELKKLNKQADGTYKTLDGTTVSIANFRDSLSSKWLTNDVLMSTLKRYGGFSQRLLRMMNETAFSESDLTVRKMLKYIEQYNAGNLDILETAKENNIAAEELEKALKELGASEYELGRRAFLASQETKTFSEAINYVKQTLQTGWAKSFEYIFGSYTEAKEFWTDVTDLLYEIFIVSGEIRNETLQLWHDNGGRADFIDALKAIASFIREISSAVDEAWKAIFPFWNNSTEMAKYLRAITLRFKEWAQSLKLTADQKSAIQSVTTFLANAIKTIFGILRGVYRLLAPTIRYTKQFFTLITKIISPLFNGASGALEFADGVEALQFAFLAVGAILAAPIKLLNRFIEWLTEMGNYTLPELKKRIDRWWDGVKKSFQNFGGMFKGLGLNVVEGFKQGILTGAASLFDAVWSVFGGVITVVRDVLGIHSPAVRGIEQGEYYVEGSIVGEENKQKDLEDTTEKVYKKGILDVVSKMGIAGKISDTVVKPLTGLFKELGESLDEKFPNKVDKWSYALENLGKVLEWLFKTILQGIFVITVIRAIAALSNSAVQLMQSIGRFSTMIPNLFGAVQNLLKSAGDALKDYVKNKFKAEIIRSFGITCLLIAASIALIAAAIIVLAKIDMPHFWRGVAVVGGIVAGIVAVIALLGLLQKAFSVAGSKNILSIGSKKGSFFEKIGFTLKSTSNSANTMATSVQQLATASMKIAGSIATVLAATTILTESLKGFSEDKLVTVMGILGLVFGIIAALIGILTVAAVAFDKTVISVKAIGILGVILGGITSIIVSFAIAMIAIGPGIKMAVEAVGVLLSFIETLSESVTHYLAGMLKFIIICQAILVASVLLALAAPGFLLMVSAFTLAAFTVGLFGISFIIAAASLWAASAIINKASESIKKAIINLVEAFGHKELVLVGYVMAALGGGLLMLGLGFIIGAAGIAALIPALVSLANNLESVKKVIDFLISDIAWEKVLDASVALAASIFAIGLAATITGPGIATIALSILAVAAAIHLVFSAMKYGEAMVQFFDKMLDWINLKLETIKETLNALAPTILKLGLVIGAFGLGLIVVGIGLALIAIATLALAVNFGIFLLLFMLFKVIMDKMKEEMPELYSAVLTFMNSISNFINSLAEFGSALMPVFEAVGDIVGGTLKTLGQDIVDFIGNVGRLAKTVATAPVNIVKGLVTGIRRRLGDVRDAGAEMGGAVQEGNDGELGINSPSTVLMASGEYAGEGLVVGVESILPDVSNAGKKMAVTFTTGFNDVLAGLWTESDEITAYRERFNKLDKKLKDKGGNLTETEWKEYYDLQAKLAQANTKKYNSAQKNQIIEAEKQAYLAQKNAHTLRGAASNVITDVKNIFGAVTSGEITIGEAFKMLGTSLKDNGGEFFGNLLSGARNKLFGKDGIFGDLSDLLKSPFKDLDLSNLIKPIDTEDLFTPYDKDDTTNIIPDTLTNGSGQGTINTYEFVQNNYSPKALSRIEIYRQTNRQFNNFRTREVLAR